MSEKSMSDESLLSIGHLIFCEYRATALSSSRAKRGRDGHGEVQEALVIPAGGLLF